MVDVDKYSLYARCCGAVSVAVKSGKLVKPSCCVLCGDSLFIEAHHEDYSKPLEVRWLCRYCHNLVHHPNRNYKKHVHVIGARIE